MPESVEPGRKRKTVKRTIPSEGNPFIVTTSLAGQDAETRKLIRRHVMLGKNKERRGPRSRPRNTPIGSWINGDHDPACQEELQTSRGAKDDAAVADTPSPRMMGSDLAFFRFADDMAPGDLELVFKFFTVIGPGMYPFDLCTAFHPQNSVWFEYLALDAGYVHSVLFATRAFFDWRGGTGSPVLSHKSLAHLAKTLELLRNRLDNPSSGGESTSESTISTVVGLTVAADCLGDRDAAAKHTAGLHRMISLRGGLGTLSHNRQLQIKACRADLGVAISGGSKPLFFSDGMMSWKSYLAPEVSRHTDLYDVLASPDQRLVNVWVDLKEFCRAANIGVVTGRKLDPELFQEVMTSVQYRLLHLDYGGGSGEGGAWHEAIRLSMLAFATTVFLKIRGLEIGYEDLSRRLRAAMLALDYAGDAVEREMMLWMAFVAGMSMFHGRVDGGWLKDYLSVAGVTSWKATRSILKDRLWVDCIHDKQGEAVYHELS
ncbi:hypothetical protein CONLIGDRAFT_444179 [Coniochaeta ligniaria NRRL 30616]|uniref:Tachykinin family protein n=1 Tax=Coniochaeta ligniaria NRRL 30616 TaxID=1408157 RepID=A0A1J7JEJ8_9PEZI|nr:hypothetical protein CONLIGDRAFT_444179 [Coniochaeta ligniaria NRRL 30616]